MKSLLLATISLLAPTVAAVSDVTIRAKRPTRSRQNGATPGWLLTPRHDHEWNLQSQGIVGLKWQQSGVPKATSWSLPSIRGQDVRLTEVFWQGISLQDPATQSTIIEDIDIKAFDQVRIVQGLLPFNRPSWSLTGGIELVEMSRKAGLVSAEWGRPFGTSLHLYSRAASEHAQWSLFWRQHTTDGRYKYFSDEGTPTNPSDDQKRTRRDLSSKSHHAFQQAKVSAMGFEWNLLSLWNQSARDVPSLSLTRPSAAKTDALQRVVIVKAVKSFGSRFAGGGYLKSFWNEVAWRDPNGDVDPLHKKRRSTTNGDEHGLLLEMDTEAVASELRWVKSTTRIRSSPERRVERLSLGSQWKGIPGWTLEPKVHGATIDDGGDRLRESSWSLANSFVYQRISTYVQLGASARPPSLLEKYGDGATVLANPELRSEKLRHQEWGIQWTETTLFSVRLQLFRDLTLNKIILLPGYLPSTFLAKNHQQVDSRGLQVGVDGTLLSRFRLTAEYQYLDARLLDSRIQPMLAPHQAQTTLNFDVGKWHYFLNGRWYSRMFRDLENDQELGSYQIWDLGQEWNLRRKGVDWRIGFGIWNIMDKDRVSFGTDTDSLVGSTPISDIRGHPLPGRHFKIFLSSSF